MDKKCIYFAAMALTAAFTLTGCSFFKSLTSSDSSQVVSVTSAEGDADTQPAGVATVEKNVFGHWTVQEVNSKRTDGDDRPYIIFDEASQRIYGNNGCNTINGDFVVEEGGVMRFDHVLTTAMACPDAQYEFLINQAINNCAYYSIERQKREWYMTLYDQSHYALMVLRRHGLDYLNGAWQIVGINSEECEDESAQLLIDIDELKLHGNNGCNILNGTILLDPDKDNSIMFQQLMTTKMACPDKMQQGTAILIALEETESCRRGKNGTAAFYDKDGNKVLQLKKIPDK